MPEFRYVGSELDLFAAANNWKSYWASQLFPFLKGDVLEVGAGIGANTPFLDRGGTGRWVCLEPDLHLATQLDQRLRTLEPCRSYESVCGTLPALENQKFDTILYIDVLEHIHNDREELKTAASYLRPGGYLIVLAPAHQSLFSAFDSAIGHFRRYNRRMLRTLAPANLSLARMRYLDCAGLFASAANVVCLEQSLPTKAQLQLWDRCMVPVSRVLDRMLLYSIGKSILAVWCKC